MRFLSPNDIADALTLSPKTVRRWISDEALPAHRIGGLLRVRESDLQAFLDQRHTPSATTPQFRGSPSPSIGG